MDTGRLIDALMYYAHGNTGTLHKLYDDVLTDSEHSPESRGLVHILTPYIKTYGSMKVMDIIALKDLQLQK